MVISDTTRQLVEPHFELKPIGTRSLKGIARPMELHHVVRSNLAVPPAGRGLPESVTLIGREGQSRLLRFTWKRLVHDTDGATRPEEAVVVVRGVAGIGKSALADALGDARAPRGRRRARGQLFPLSRQRRTLARRAHARATARLLSGPAAGGAARRTGSRLEDAGLDGDTVPLLAPLLGLDARRAVVATGSGRTRAAPTDAPGPRRLARAHGGLDADPGAGRGPPLGRPDHRRPVGDPGDRGRPRRDDPHHEPAPARCAVGVVRPRHRTGTAQGEAGGGAGRRADRRRPGHGAVSPDRRARGRCPPLPSGADPQHRHRGPR